MCLELALVSRLCMRGSLAELLEILDGKNNRPDGRHREWFFLILVSRSIMGRPLFGNDATNSPLIWN